jgi:hypothetical protein
MLRHFIHILLLTVIFTSCNSVDNETVNSAIDNSKKDTTIYLNINGVRQSFLLHKDNKIDLRKFQDFLNKFPTIPPVYYDTINVDINGDSINEKVISQIINENGEFTIYSTILMNNKIISQDTLKTNNDLAYMDWGNDSIYFKLKPYSAFYDAYRDKQVIEELENGKLDDGIIEFYTSGVSARLKDKTNDTIFINHCVDSITKELQNYKGKIVTSLEHWDRSILIWNKNSETLEIIYTP